MYFIIEQAINSLISFIIGVVIVNNSGVDIYGKFAVYILFSLFFLNVIYNLVTAPMLMSTKNLDRHFMVSFLSLMLFSTLASMILYVSSPKDYWLISIYCLIFCFDDCCRKVSIKLRVFSVLFARLAFISTAIFLYSNVDIFRSLIGFVLLYSIAMLAFIFYFQYRCVDTRVNSLKIKDIYCSIDVYKRNLIFSFTSIGQWVSTNSLNMLAYSILPSLYIGAIKSAQNISSVFNFAIISSESYLLSKLNDKKLDIKTELAKFLMCFCLILMCIIILVCIYKDDLIGVIYIEHTEIISDALSILIFLPLGSLINLTIKVYVRMKGLAKSLLISSFLSSFISFFWFYYVSDFSKIESLPYALLVASYSTAVFWIIINKFTSDSK